MSVNWQQFEKNKKWINKKIDTQYKGVTVSWVYNRENETSTPNIHIPEKYLDEVDDIIAAVQQLISRCGSEAVFYPEKAY